VIEAFFYTSVLRMKKNFVVLLGITIFSCSKISKQLSSGVCVSDELASKEIQTEDKHLQKFTEEMLFIEKGHFLSGVYQLGDEVILSSLYSGNKVDSIASTLFDSKETKNSFDSQHYWFQSNELVYLISSSEIICISLPSNLKGKDLSIEDLNKLFKTCD
jgi:hypothetical protein